MIDNLLNIFTPLELKWCIALVAITVLLALVCPVIFTGWVILKTSLFYTGLSAIIYANHF